MFDFLKKKLKLFEKNIEAEIESELKKEEKKEQKLQMEPQIQPVSTPISAKPVETPPEAPVIPKEEKPVVTRKRALRKQKPVSEEKKQREKQFDKQIEESIESELQRALQTRKSIEETVGAEKKSTWTIDEKKLDELLWDLEMGLLEADVAYSVIDSIKKDVKQEIRRVPFDKGKAGDLVETVLKNAIGHVLKANNFDFNRFIDERKKPVVIMFVGVNGTGKTLSIAKIAYQLQKVGKTCVMAAGDTFRAGAIEQLTIHADNLGVKIVKHGPGSDPAAVAYDAIEHAKAKHKDVVLLDTAGRMQTNSNLMDEMAKIKRVAKPDMIIFVGDALSGNDAVEQAKRFNEVVGIDGVILTKVDADAKGGSSLSIAYTIGKPLLFIGVGQGYEDQIAFNPGWMVKHIFGDEA
ncbi:MAG: signal recognition particle-docking protein FtsY [Candidatus Thermoplasmatota archaeon]|nr:signal recognition particle-docking protein FtsY [Candidatus Thermoplasmatota archaeon]